MNAVKTIVVIILATSFGRAQDYSSFTSTVQSLYKAGTQADTAQRKKAVNEIWTSLQHAHSIPLVHEDSVAFLYKGEAASVVWIGDFNGWGFNKTFHNKGKKITGTDIWVLRSSFPKNARLDYKIFLNGVTWLIDPENPHQQWSGVGGGSLNSELRMPDWKEDAILMARPDVNIGKLISDVLLHSKVLGYQLTYSVYMPFHYSKDDKLPVVYITDGYEYMAPRLGNMITILDNLIHDKKIKPIAVVFVDNREPTNRSNNKRMQELAMSNQYLDFFVKELIPQIEKKYPVAKEASNRAIMGNSMGGLTATYFAFTKPDIFGMAGIQSPAFWTKPQIYSICSNSANPEMRISMTSGLFNDTSEESRKMKAILEANSCVHYYREVNEGHSWGNWRNLIDDILIDFFGTKP
jgi:Enterochelin esterase and related enzymes